MLHSSVGDLSGACQVDTWSRKAHENEVHEVYLHKNDWKASDRDCFDTTPSGGEGALALAYFLCF